MTIYQIWPDNIPLEGSRLSRSWPLNAYPEDVGIEVLREVAAAHWAQMRETYGFDLSEPEEDFPDWKIVGKHFRSSVAFIGLLPGDREQEGGADAT